MTIVPTKKKPTKKKFDLATEVTKYRNVTAALKELEEQKKAMAAKIIGHLEAKGVNKAVVTAAGTSDETLRATVVRAETTTIDEERLIGDLTSEQLDMVLVEVIDKGRLEDAMARGDIDPSLVTDCSTMTPKKPYLKVSVDKGDHEEGEVVPPIVTRARKKSRAALEMEG